MNFLKKQKLSVIILLVIISIPAIFPLIHRGFFVTDDGEWMIIRLSDFFSTLRYGQFPVRFLGRLNFGYGYPVATFLYPGIMYFGSIIHIFKTGFVSSIKIILGLSLVGSLVFTYLWLRRLFEKTAAFIGSIFYLYLPYHLVDVYTRGSVGEVFALLWVPFIFWNIERRNLFFLSIGITLLILSHNTLSLLFLPLIMIYMLIKILHDSKNKKKLSYNYFFSLVLGFGMSAFFIIPAILELHYTRFSKTQISDPLNYFADINMIGWSSIFVLISGIFIIYNKRREIEKDRIFILFLIFGLFSLIFSSFPSSFFWKVVPAGFIQFPFRLLSVTLLSVSFVAAFVVSKIENVYRKVFIAFAIFLLCISTYQYILSVKFTDKGEGFYITNDATTTVKDEYMPMWAKELPQKRPDKKVEIIKGSGAVENISINSKRISFNTNLDRYSTIQLNTIYWPGWEVFVDGEESRILYNNRKGLMTVNESSGKHVTEFRFAETISRKVSDVLSIVSLLALMLYVMKIKHEVY